MAKHKLVWWTLQWPNGDLDIDAGNEMHLYQTRKEALIRSQDFEPPIPVPVKIQFHVIK